VRRSIILEELVDRWLVKVSVIVAVYITFRGHNAPGGGFAGGLIVGAAFVLRYLTGRTLTIARRPLQHPSRLMGLGLLLAIVTVLAPLVVGSAALESHIWKLSIPAIGEVKFVSSTFFDLGVFFVVIGVVLMILVSLGSEGDRIALDDGRESL
jgi:multicomponent Na+:H+ antiporter subunit A